MADFAGQRVHRRSRAETEQQRKILEVAKIVSATVGQDFFRALVEHLATALHGDCVYVAELVEIPMPRVQTIAVYRDGAPAQNFAQDLQGSSAKQLLEDGLLGWSKDVCRIFPADPLLEEMRAEGYAGIRLSDSDGQIIGLIALLARDPLQHLPVAKSVLSAFATRAAAELERKRADDALRESEQRYRAFVSMSSDAMWRVEFATPVPLDASEDEQIERIYRDGYVAECNDAMARLTGARSTDELIGTPFSALFHQSDERVREELRQGIRSKFDCATVFTTLLGPGNRKLYRIRTQCGIVEKNELRRIWGATRDITDLKMAELAVEASERRFREVLENVHLPGLMLNQQGDIAFCNDALVSLAGPNRELLGQNWLGMIQNVRERDTWASLLSKEFADEQSQLHFEGLLQLQDAPPRVIVWDAVVLRDEVGEPVGLAAIGSDRTEQRILESRLAQAEKLEAIGRLAAGVAHDLNNSLTLIMSYLELGFGVEHSESMGKTLVGIQSATADCALLAEQLLAIGRRQQLRPELLNVNAAIAAQRETLERIVGPNITVVQELDAAVALVWVDPVQVRRILINLAANSRDAMPSGGTFKISTSIVRIDTDPGAPPIGPTAGEYVRLIVTDTGSGLRDDVKRRLFEPFFTTKPPGKGAGLGLATVHAIVTQSGGYISAWSPGIGTVIEILLPRRWDVPEKTAR